MGRTYHNRFTWKARDNLLKQHIYLDFSFVIYLLSVCIPLHWVIDLYHIFLEISLKNDWFFPFETRWSPELFWLFQWGSKKQWSLYPEESFFFFPSHHLRNLKENHQTLNDIRMSDNTTLAPPTSNQGPTTPRKGPPKFKQRQTRQFKSKPPKKGVKG